MDALRSYLRFEPKPRENPWLDLVRAIAIVLVLLRHGQVALTRSSGAAPSTIETIFLNGWIGVDLFFVLSGYLISQHLLRDGLDSGRFSFSRYLTGRALRILPAYFVALAMTAAAVFPLFPVDPSALGLRIAYHVLFLQDYLPANINVVFWSLGVEEKFYLLAPVLLSTVVALRSLRQRLLLLGAVAAVSIFARPATYALQATALDYGSFFTLLRSPFHMCLEPLIAGVAIAVIQKAGRLDGSSRVGRGLFAASAIALLALLASHEFVAVINLYDTMLQPLLIAAGAAGLTVGAVMLRTTPMPGAAIVRPIAHLSFALYLMHFPLTPLALALAGETGAATLTFWFVYLALSALLAVALHFVVEKPFLLLKDGGRTGEPLVLETRREA